jgi:hypothetical protein
LLPTDKPGRDSVLTDIRDVQSFSPSHRDRDL